MYILIKRYLNKRIKELNKVKSEGDITDYGRGKLTAYKEVLELLCDHYTKEEMIVTYFSPFTDEPVMVETETNTYMVDVKKVIEKED